MAALAVGCTGSSSPTSPTPPAANLSLICPADVDSTSPTGQPLPVSYQVPTATGGTAPVTTTCTPPSGSTFPIGTTAVGCRATDQRQQQAVCSFRVTVKTPPKLTYTRFLAFGDSLTEGKTSAAVPTGLFGTYDLIAGPSYPYQLSELMKVRYSQQQVRMDNEGLAGEKAVNAVGRLKDEVNRKRPEVLLLMHGTNDLLAEQEGALNDVEGALTSMIDNARERGVQVVFLATVPPWRPGGPKQLDASLPPKLNTMVVSLAGRKGAELVDLHQDLASNLALYIGNDNLHPTETGYKRMAELFLEAIKRRLESPAAASFTRW